jgi:NADPH:quinone reductase-like Zn-dependent oxidoreductase
LIPRRLRFLQTVQTMKAIRIHSYGGSDQIRVEDASRPTPGPGEVLVKIRAAGVNPIDWKIREGFMSQVAPKSFPFTLGQDFSGEVIEIGSGVEKWRSGDLVFGFVDGAYAEFGVTSADMIAKMPENIDLETAAGLPTPALTAYQIVTNVLRVSEGMSVLIHGAAGGVGSIATQLCSSMNARVIATASEQDHEYLHGLGADLVIDYQNERFEDEVADVDAVIDLIGGETQTRTFAVMKKGGTLVTTVGSLNETEAAKYGVKAVHFVMTKNRSDLEKIGLLVDQGKLKVRVTRIIPIIKAKEAQDLNQTGQAHGKLILKTG